MLRSTCIAAAFAVLNLAPLHAVAAEPALDTKSIESITGLEGSFDKTKQVFKLSKPRDDVKVVVDGWTLPSFMGTGSWAAFKSAGDGAMLMGDTVLFEDEVNEAMSAALKSGLEVTALHNHFFFDEPKVYFMHIAGMGDAEELAKGVKAVYDEVARVRAKDPKPRASFGGQIPAKSSITPGPIEELLGEKAQTKDGMAKVVIGRTAEMHGVTMGKAMGVNTWAAFAGSDQQAVVGRRLRDARARTAAGPQGDALGRHQHRGDSPPHDSREAALHLPARPGARTRQDGQGSPRRAGGEQVGPGPQEPASWPGM